MKPVEPSPDVCSGVGVTMAVVSKGLLGTVVEPPGAELKLVLTAKSSASGPLESCTGTADAALCVEKV